MFDGLLIADVRVHAIEHGETGPLVRGDGKPSLGHAHQQPHRLQGDGLAARVGAGDEKDKPVVVNVHVDGHDLVARNEGVAGAAQVKHGARMDRQGGCVFLAGARGHRMGTAKGQHLGDDRVQILRVASLGKEQIQVREHLHRAVDVGRFLCYQVAQVGQDAADLSLLLQFQFPHLVAHLHHGQGFHEEGGAAGRLVVNQSWNAPLVLGLEGDNVAAVALGDEGFLKVLSDFGVVDHALQSLGETFPLLAQPPADVGQFGAGRVHHLARVVQTAPDFVGHVLTRLNLRGPIGQVGVLVLPTYDGLANNARPLQGAANVQQFVREQHLPPVSLIDQGADVVDAAHVQRGGLEEQSRLAGFLQPPAHVLQVPGRFQV